MRQATLPLREFHPPGTQNQPGVLPAGSGSAVQVETNPRGLVNRRHSQIHPGKHPPGEKM